MQKHILILTTGLISATLLFPRNVVAGTQAFYNDTTYCYDYDYVTISWNITDRTIRTYDADGNELTNSQQIWDVNTLAWVDDDNYTYTYNANGYRTSILRQVRDANTASLV